ncbi:MAG: type II secretion system F family protein [Pseudomonadota bacterium]
MLTAVMLSVFSTVSVFMVLLLSYIFREKLNINKRIKNYVYTAEKEVNQHQGTFIERIIRPIIGKTTGFMDRITPQNYYNQMEKRIKEAGNPKGVSVGGIVFLQICMTCFAIAVAALLRLSGGASVPKIIVIIASMLGIINMLPKYYLKSRIALRQKEIEKSLPDALDLLTVAIEAGLSFDGAVAKLVEKMSGVLVDEFAIALKEMRVGVSKREAFKSLIERVPVPSLVTFVGSILQADQLGVSMGNVLRIQSSLARQKRMQKAQESAMKAPVKMLIPMVLFIMPTIFIVILGPVVIMIMKAF